MLHILEYYLLLLCGIVDQMKKTKTKMTGLGH